jgi:hypothetical protein
MGYLDPNLFGIISQIGYIVFFAIVTALLFFPRLILNFFRKNKTTIPGPDPSDQKKI